MEGWDKEEVKKEKEKIKQREDKVTEVNSRISETYEAQLKILKNGAIMSEPIVVVAKDIYCALLHDPKNRQSGIVESFQLAQAFLNEAHKQTE